MSSQRATIIGLLVIKLQTITVANGYSTAIGTKVYPWRKTPLGESELPCLIVQDMDINRDLSAVLGMSRNTMNVEIVGLLSGSATAANARALEYDLITCLHGYETLGGCASFMQVDRSSITMEQNENIGGAVTMTLSIEYDTARAAI